MVLLHDEGGAAVDREFDGWPRSAGVARVAPRPVVDARGVIPDVQPGLEGNGRRVLGHATERVERRVEAGLFRLGEGAALLGDDHDDTQVLGHQVFRGDAVHIGRGEAPVHVGKVPVVTHAAEERRLAQRFRQTVQALRLLPLLFQEPLDLSLDLVILQAALLEGGDFTERGGGGGVGGLG